VAAEIDLYGVDSPGLTTLLIALAIRTPQQNSRPSDNLSDQIAKVRNGGLPHTGDSDESLKLALSSPVPERPGAPVDVKLSILRELPGGRDLAMGAAQVQALDDHYNRPGRILYIVANPFRLNPVNAEQILATKINSHVRDHWPASIAVFHCVTTIFGFRDWAELRTTLPDIDKIVPPNLAALDGVAKAICEKLEQNLPCRAQRDEIQAILTSVRNSGLILTRGDVSSEYGMVLGDQLLSTRKTDWERRLVAGRPSFRFQRKLDPEAKRPRNEINFADTDAPWLEQELLPQVWAAASQPPPQVSFTEVAPHSYEAVIRLAIARWFFSAHWLVLVAWILAMMEYTWGVELLHRAIISHTNNPAVFVPLTNEAFSRPQDDSLIWWLRDCVVLLAGWLFMIMLQVIGENRWTGVIVSVTDPTGTRYRRQTSLLSKLFHVTWQFRTDGTARMLLDEEVPPNLHDWYRPADGRVLLTGVLLLMISVLAATLPSGDQINLALGLGVVFLLLLLPTYRSK